MSEGIDWGSYIWTRNACLLLEDSEGKKRVLSRQNSTLDFFCNLHETLHRHLYFWTWEMETLTIRLHYTRK